MEGLRESRLCPMLAVQLVRWDDVGGQDFGEKRSFVNM